MILYVHSKGVNLDVADALEPVDLEAWYTIYKNQDKEFIAMLAQACMTGKI